MLRLESSYLNTEYQSYAINISDIFCKSLMCEICNANTTCFSRLVNITGNVALEKRFCNTCNHFFFSTLPIKRWFDDFYSQKWKATETIGNRKTTFISSYPDKKFNRIFNYINSATPVVIDIGAGNGHFLLKCARKEFDVHGIDASEQRARYCRDYLNLNVHHFSEIDGPSKDVSQILTTNTYDVVHCNHVLEHVFDLDATLDLMIDICKVEGLVAIFVPIGWQEHSLFVSHFLPHIRNFSELSLTTALAQRGLELISTHVGTEIAVLAKKTTSTPCHKKLYLPDDQKQCLTTLEDKVLLDFLGTTNSISFIDCQFLGNYYPSYNKTIHILDSKFTVNQLPWKLKKVLIGLRNDSESSNNNIFRLFFNKFKNLFLPKLLKKLLTVGRGEFGGTLQSIDNMSTQYSEDLPIIEFVSKNEDVLALIK